MWWEGEKEPSVEVPIGNFFGLGHARMRAYQCFPFNVTSGGGEVGENSALNGYFQMPFGKSARITVENQGPSAVSAFYDYFDYETYSNPLPKDTLRFHAQWRRENPTQGIKGHLAALAKPAGLALHFTTKAGDSAWTRVPEAALGGGAVDLRRIFIERPTTAWPI